MSYEDALALLRNGHLQELVNKLSAMRDLRTGDPKFRVLLAYALALTDGAFTASSLLEGDGRLSPFLKIAIRRGSRNH